jgi:hypothetical protein
MYFTGSNFQFYYDRSQIFYITMTVALHPSVIIYSITILVFRMIKLSH